ncbi:MAG: L-2-amino-thiazoline-4-carboxylic acid hydrolase [Anaerolineales bacterium]|jgi:hypothetical protein
MNEQEGKEYYLSRKPEILRQFDIHARGWRPFLITSYGDEFTEAVLKEAREQYDALIPDIPYIGGDENPMTRHLVRSTTSLVLYQVMKARGKTAEEVGKVVHDAVVEFVSQLPPRLAKDLSAEYIVQEKQKARKSQERRYPDDWVWEFVEGDTVGFDYGYDFLECGTQKLYHAYGADEFLPFYCYLDFVTHRTIGWGFARTMTLAEGHEKCDFRWKKGGETRKGWPPPFLKKECS